MPTTPTTRAIPDVVDADDACNEGDAGIADAAGNTAELALPDSLDRFRNDPRHCNADYERNACNAGFPESPVTPRNAGITCNACKAGFPCDTVMTRNACNAGIACKSDFPESPIADALAVSQAGTAMTRGSRRVVAHRRRRHRQRKCDNHAAWQRIRRKVLTA